MKNILCGLALTATPALAFAGLPTKNRTGKLSFFNVNTNEKLLNVPYVLDSGQFDRIALRDLDYFFRCTYNGEVHKIDAGLFYWLDILKTQMGYPNARYRLYSGYRSRQYNRILRETRIQNGKKQFPSTRKGGGCSVGRSVLARTRKKSRISSVRRSFQVQKFRPYRCGA